MKYSYILGIDVSKEHLDYALLNTFGELVAQHRVPNDGLCAQSIWQSVLDKHSDATLENTLVCAEYTGMYCYHLTQWACQGATLCLVSGKEIKYSGGIRRGKDDALDAQRIAQYAYRYTDKITLWQATQSGVIEQLKHLDSLRDRLVRAQNALQTPLKEQKNFTSAEHYAQLSALTQPSIDALGLQIKAVEKAIDDIFDQDEHLKSLLHIMDSVPGVGKKVARAIITKTNALKRFNTPQKLATHAGVAPFKYESGSSVKGKTGVSHNADKELKKLLHLAALGAAKTKGHYREYYERKKKEGKAPMSVLNAIRNKIIHVIYALCKKNELFDENFDYSIA